MNTIQALIRRAELAAGQPVRRGASISKVSIGSRWKPGHVVRIDTEAGTFEEVNAPLASSTEAYVQAALLAPKPTGYPVTWWAIVLLSLAGAVVLTLNTAAP